MLVRLKKCQALQRYDEKGNVAYIGVFKSIQDIKTIAENFKKISLLSRVFYIISFNTSSFFI